MPRFVNSRETCANIKLINTAIIITHKCLLTSDEIRLSLNAYTLMAREFKSDYVHLHFEKLARAFRMVNKVISSNIIKEWFSHCESNLTWSNKDWKRFSVNNNESEYVGLPFILPNEFLFLMCNTTDRLDIIKKLHNPVIKSKKSKIYNWEIIDIKG